MKHIIPILLAIMLVGCSVQQNPTQPSSTTTQIIPETTSTATEAPTQAQDPLERKLEDMTLREKVGQLFLTQFPDANTVKEIEKFQIGGYILFSYDIKNHTPESLKRTLDEYHSVSKIPLLIATDEEGGSVTRLSRVAAFRTSPFSSPRKLYSDGGMENVLASETEKAQLLSSVGINVNLGPVCDVTTDSSAFMYSRSLGQDPATIGEFVKNTVTIMANNHVGSVLKHFPGYGNNNDTHTGIATDNRSLSELEEIDLVPFAAGIEAGCNAIMVSHIYVNAIDPTLPATLSPAVHDYLRNNMNFQGVIVTDDLDMQAITDTYGAGEAAVMAVLAGNDLLCSTKCADQFDAIIQAVYRGRISQTRLDESVMRILRWKQAIGLIP